MDGGATTLGLLSLAADTIRWMQKKQAGAKTAQHVTNTCISPRKLIKGSPNPIIAMSQRLESYYSKVDVWNPIIAKRDVWSPIIANFSIIKFSDGFFKLL
jgi:hypothetical protein